MPDISDEEFPVVLLTGRGAAGQSPAATRAAKSSALGRLYPKLPYIELHPDDAEAIGVQHGETVVVRSRRGEVTAAACLSATVRRGQAFMPMHYEATNRLTLRCFDTRRRQPRYKYCTVLVSPVLSRN